MTRAIPISGWRLSLLCVFVLSQWTAVGAEGPPLPDKGFEEYQVKAVWLVNFIKYVDWPDKGQRRQIVLGIVGRDPFGHHLNALEGLTLGPNKLVIKRLGAYDPVGVGVWPECDLVFISGSEQRRIPSIVKYFSSKGTLTISESKAFLEQGGMINFLTNEKNVRFEINQASAMQAGLRVKSALLKNAIRVILAR